MLLGQIAFGHDDDGASGNRFAVVVLRTTSQSAITHHQIGQGYLAGLLEILLARRNAQVRCVVSERDGNGGTVVTLQLDLLTSRIDGGDFADHRFESRRSLGVARNAVKQASN